MRSSSTSLLRDEEFQSAPPPELDRLEREIAATDAEIDELIYELYAVTDYERNSIQGHKR
jgi:hypothetical protein